MKRKLISNDIKKLVQSAVKTGSKPVKYELGQFTKIAIGDVIITKSKGERPVMNLTEHYNADYAKLWYADVGKILLKELKGEENNLYEIKTDMFDALIKLITKDELEEFKTNGFDHLKIDEDEYTIIKVVTKKKRYSDKTDDYDFDFDYYEMNNNSDIIDFNSDEDVDYNTDDKDEKSNSYALF